MIGNVLNRKCKECVAKPNSYTCNILREYTACKNQIFIDDKDQIDILKMIKYDIEKTIRLHNKKGD